jgi:hypothetical protein
MKHLTILICIALFASCQFLTPEIPIDWVGWHPTDPTDTIQPIEFDTCENLVTLPSPKFVCFWTNLDQLPSDLTWQYANGTTWITIDPVQFFSQYGSVHIYNSGINIGGTLTGNVTNSQFNGRISLIGTGMTRTHLVFANEFLHFRGSALFFQFMDELESHPHPKQIRFANTGYTCENINEFVSYLLDQCLLGNGTKIYFLDLLQCVSLEDQDRLVSNGYIIY